MKQRILTGWTFIRVLYLIMGSFVIVQSIADKQWLGVAFGGYFAAMGLFAFGCAAGNCFGNSCTNTTKQFKEGNINDVEFEEIKSN